MDPDREAAAVCFGCFLGDGFFTVGSFLSSSISFGPLERSSSIRSKLDCRLLVGACEGLKRIFTGFVTVADDVDACCPDSSA